MMFDCCGGMMLWAWGLGILLIALIVGVVVYAAAGRRTTSTGTDALTILRERYARGEIDQTEYDERSRVLRGQAPVDKPR